MWLCDQTNPGDRIQWQINRHWQEQSVGDGTVTWHHTLEYFCGGNLGVLDKILFDTEWIERKLQFTCKRSVWERLTENVGPTGWLLKHHGSWERSSQIITSKAFTAMVRRAEDVNTQSGSSLSRYSVIFISETPNRQIIIDVFHRGVTTLDPKFSNRQLMNVYHACIYSRRTALIKCQQRLTPEDSL